MAWTINAAVNAAGLNGVTALFNSGRVVLSSSAPAELAAPTFGATAFGAATSATPAVASANALTADTTVTAGTITAIDFQTSGNASRISGSVGVGSGDFQVSSNVIPGGTTSVNLVGLQFTLAITG
jgi:hypothetical protein